MGDRNYIKIEESKGGKIYFYTHWSGSELENILADALDRGRSRWNDESYLARIIFCEMVKNDILGETSFGISTWEPDTEYPEIIVHMNDLTVSIKGKSYKFQEFIDKEKTK
jgi:hypothetical protein